MTVPFVGATRFGAHAFAVQVGAGLLHEPLAWHVVVDEPVSV